ncbi:hypothetical protein BO83DRAFT_360346 [Aspergillus eucalypticola CBS 122712]|uniref:F-box domain-containing protein n=1 Tax=Aspergillus eucalypticola (strain CBS 122712 / IBT 29274) TaxID=1448314 RepID=A0A317VIK5_ASPEC|nr:uncharacterized protein BO83DRAFT_360346 [Aspergillus eucalypticola CBS 122712]PWY74163.1 hypothetical protein BO83DRAFT_360346 [Aspergillus eucalypticola CBS 122712]
MPVLSILPADVLLHVISFLDHSGDVYSLSLLSPSLFTLIHGNDLVNKTKYRCIRITCTPDLKHAYTILLDILRDHNLASYVRHIEMDIPVRSPLNYKPREYDRPVDPGDMQRLRIAATRAGFNGPEQERLLNMAMQETDYAKDWQYLTYYNTQEDAYHGKSPFIAQALAVLLIASSPNLTSLAISPPFWEYTSPRFDDPSDNHHSAAKIEKYPLAKFLQRASLGHFIKNGEKKFSYLASLKYFQILTTEASSFHIARSRACAPQDLCLCIELVRTLPSIESLRMQAIQGFGSATSAALEGLLLPSSASISRLDLRGCDFKSDLLCKVIHAMKCLKELRYSVVHGGCYAGFAEFFDRYSLIKAVLRHRATLEVLDLEFDDHLSHFVAAGGSEVREDAEDESVLKEFESLRSLSLGVSCLWYLATRMGELGDIVLVDHLPLQLEYLRIRGYEKGHTKALDNMLVGMESTRDKHPALWTVQGINEYIPVGK